MTFWVLDFGFGLQTFFWHFYFLRCLMPKKSSGMQEIIYVSDLYWTTKNYQRWSSNSVHCAHAYSKSFEPLQFYGLNSRNEPWEKSSATSVYFSKAKCSWLNHTCLQQHSKFRLREHRACYVWHLVKVLKDSKLGDLKLSTVHTKPKKVNQPVNSFFKSAFLCVP